MKNILPKDLLPDFIKIDAEGADLEILKGANNFLSTSCLGIQIEVSFAHRHKKAPYFSEIDQYLREYGYTLMDIETERWIRKNNIFSITSNPQLIWGNAIYVLSIDSFFERVLAVPENNRQSIFVKFITILLIHKFHDYAYEVCEKAFRKKMISKEIYSKCSSLIVQSLSSKKSCFTRLSISIFIGFISIILFGLFPKKRKSALNYLKDRLRDFAKLLLNLRYGPNNTCV